MKHIFSIYILLSTFQILSAQNSLELFLQAQTTEQSVEVFWIPMSPEIWEQHRTSGYTVTRAELSDNGTPISSEVIHTAMIEKDSIWFINNAQLANGIMDPIGALLYDTTFQFPSNDLLDGSEMKYNYIMEEVRNYPEIANALGLGFVDNTAKRDVLYRYTIKNIDSSIEASVELLNSFFSYNTYPSDTTLAFSHPNDLSLSDMYIKAFPIEQEYIRAIGKAYGDSIVIRWGLNSPKMWETAKETGFEVYRTLDATEYELIATVKPWAETEITEAIAYDSMALVAAGILYGQDEYNTEAGRSVYEQNSIFENNLGFALMAAERSALAAEILGFRYVDKDVNPDDTYIYLVSTDGVEDMWDAGKATIKNIMETLTPPSRLQLTPKDNSIRLEWNKEENEGRFSSYNIEKSEDGINYTSLTPNKLVFMETAELPLYRYVYTDSVANNGQDYYYRVYGYDAFGEVSAPAEVKGQAVDLTPPLVVDMGFSEHRRDTDEIYISWELPEAQHADFDYYQVLSSDESEGIYGALSEPLGNDVTEYKFPLKDIDTDRAFFFKVQSVDKNGNISQSILTQVVVPDLIAPEPPSIINGYVDSFSFVHVEWEHSIAKDVQGYWLYWGNDTIQEMSPVNAELLTENYYTYYLDKESLSKAIYFCVRAQDDSYNRGLISEIIEVKRLDYNAPITPYEFYTTSGEDGISITWELSPSEDVEGQILYKQHESETDWSLLDSLDNITQEYTDQVAEYGEDYSYFILAYDDSGNVSDTSVVRTTSVKFPNEEALVNNFSISNESRTVRMSWDYQSDPKVKGISYQFEVYKSDGVGTPSFFREVGSDKTFMDKEVQSKVIYNYAIRVRYDNGWIGDLSEVKSVMIQ
ncbi:MAG: hypothetical protein V3V00_06295 [Saprospiraceae bacterium]